MRNQILLYYKYVAVADPEQFMHEQLALCKKLGLKGRIIIAKEGINGTVEGLEEKTEEYMRALTADTRFADIHFKKSEGDGKTFPRISVRVRSEIVTLGAGERDVNPAEFTAQYVTAQELHEWIHGPNKREVYIVDMRNDYEYRVGHFQNSIFPGLTNFRDLPELLPKIEHLRGKTVVTVCTGGVRCEKASGFLLKAGFKDVYQLFGGIVTYMERYPNQDFLGALYVFDGRITMAFNSSEHPHVIVASCDKCGAPSEQYVNCGNDACHKHFICCESCSAEKLRPFCSLSCRLIAKYLPFRFSLK